MRREKPANFITPLALESDESLLQGLLSTMGPPSCYLPFRWEGGQHLGQKTNENVFFLKKKKTHNFAKPDLLHFRYVSD